VCEFIRNKLNTIEWLLGILAATLPLIAWLSRNDVGELTLYSVFPPLGLIAFGLMWTHFAVGALRRFSGVEKRRPNLYMPISMGLVLALLLLHPGLLAMALYVDGFGLPPGSYLEAYSTQVGFVSLGLSGLIVFLSFELKRFFGEKSWWRYVGRLQIVGMAAIFIHGLGLGGEVRIDWFLVVWLTYGATLIVSVVYSWKFDRRNEKALAT
jgi:hypothetical protein